MASRPIERLSLAALAAAWLLAAGCSSRGDEGGAAHGAPERETPVTTGVAVARDVSVTLESVGKVESLNAPSIAAETEGPVLVVRVDAGEAVEAGQEMAQIDAEPLRLELEALRAEVRSLTAEIDNGERTVRRYRDLAERNLIAREQLDGAEANLAALAARREAARARAAVLEDQVRRARIVAPFAGRIERRFIAPGDYVKKGDPLFRLADIVHLRALLPFPETVAERLRPGQELSMWTPVAPEETITATITELRPMVGTGNRSVTVLADIVNPGNWRPEATIVARVVVDRRPDAVVVPRQAVVRRPAGEVVYVVADGRAWQRVVEVGERIEDYIEVLQGLAIGERVAIEGASFLTDGARVLLINGES
jgi:RND family efflux transporter MFP subunit